MPRNARLAALLACALVSVPAMATTPMRLVLFDDLPSGPMALGEEDQRYLAFGESIFDFYSDRQFSALSTLVVNQARGLFNQETAYAELLMGELYVSYGLPRVAETIFDSLLRQDMLAQTRAETFLHKAQLHYRHGEYATARRLLESRPLQALPPELAGKRQLMLANILINEGNFSAAASQLESVDPGSVAGAYARYNMAVAQLRGGDLPRGLSALWQVVRLPPQDGEINALRDRAALTTGLTELRRGQLEEARHALLQVRADGPFSNEALMVLGLVNFERGDARAALPLWLELARRHPAHESVQEALLLAPRAYEELGADSQALAGYRIAAERYRDALHQVEQAIRNVDQPGWLNTLADNGGQRREVDPMARLARFEQASGEEMPYLYALFASHRFAEQHHQYQQIARLRELLERRQRELPVLIDTALQRQRQQEQVLSNAEQRLKDLQARQERLSEQAERLAMAMRDRLDMSAPEHVADLPQSFMWQRIEALMSQPMDRRQRERLERVRGLLLWEIANEAAPRRRAQSERVSGLRDETRVQGLRTAAVAQLVADNREASRSDLPARLRAESARIDALIADADATLAELTQQLKNEALRALAERRTRLGEQLGEAHLAIARIQDAAYSRRGAGERRP